MAQITYESITVDRCTNCRGMWFDHLEAEKLKRVRGSEKIDSGLSRTGESYDTIKDIACPRCSVPMTQAEDPGKELSYETCSKCRGIFLDAGEFKEFKHDKSILDFLKKFL
ncbi:MAG: hypothetical protein A2521_04920 [Deltaproteobacteria bacterium RIFOXYD12_FULL_57_12]|nr:MAG: hypothetical protein A2521_04920 [Deltaproteobacteria bacterium RIFOXYD12_FULL_57_12]